VPDQDILLNAYIRKTEALAQRLCVAPGEVYDTLVERGYTGQRLRHTVPTDESVALVASLFRPEEVLPVFIVSDRFDAHANRKAVESTDSQRYVKEVLCRNCGEQGKRRFRRVTRGNYRLQLSDAELRAAIIGELTTQRMFVGSRRLMELFDVSHDRLLQVLGPLVSQGRIVSKPNGLTRNRDWCLDLYAKLFPR
jgi:hypothetical protein